MTIHAAVVARIINVVVMTRNAAFRHMIQMCEGHWQNRLGAVIKTTGFRLFPAYGRATGNDKCDECCESQEKQFHNGRFLMTANTIIATKHEERNIVSDGS